MYCNPTELPQRKAVNSLKNNAVNATINIAHALERTTKEAEKETKNGGE